MKVAVQSAVEYGHLGYGTFSSNLVRGLEQCGVEVWTPPEGEYARPCPPGYRTTLWPSVPHHAQGQWAGQRSVLFSMWETQSLPPMFSSNMHNYDLVMAPCQQNVDLFSEFHLNVVKVPLGYDTRIWKPMERQAPERTFRFLFCGAGAVEKTRKGPDIAINGFLKAFPKWETMTPSPRLVVKCLKHPPTELPFMELHVGKVPVIELAELYRTCHAMVLPSRGEGWGYHPQQALATGIPAIVSALPAHMEYAYLPGFQTIPVTSSKAPRFLHGEAGMWWEPDVDACAEAMRNVYDDYDEWRLDAQEGAVLMAERFSERRMAEDVISAIGPGDLIGCKTGAWERFTEAHYALRVNRYLHPSECDIGGTSYEFHPETTYWVPAQVRQSIIAAGYCANESETLMRLPDEVAA